MQKSTCIGIGFATVLVFVSLQDNLYAQPMGSGMCLSAQEMNIPGKLPKPQNEEWVRKLRQILSLEKLSQAQYKADSEKYQVNMPYMMVIPQEENHIEWISKLFTAYGLPSDAKLLTVKKSKTLTHAYEMARKLEVDLIPQYEWLIKNARDNNTMQVLDTILLETRMHHTMFDHALRMGWMRGHSMGHGTGRGGMMYRGR